MSYKFSDVWGEIGYYYSHIVEGLPEKGALSVIPAAFSALFVGESLFFVLWFVCNVIDLLLGIKLSFEQNEFSRARLYGWVVKTLTHTGTILLVSIVTFMLSGLGVKVIPLTDWFMFVLVLTEITSILSSAHKLGYPVHPFIIGFIDKLRNRAEKKIDDAASLGADKDTKNEEENNENNFK